MDKLTIGEYRKERCTHDSVIRTGVVVYIDATKYTVQFEPGYRECYQRDSRKRAKEDV